MYRVITIARQYGSGGAQIAQRLAEHLGWKLLDHDLILKIAQTAKVQPEVAARYDESVDSWLYRLGKSAFAHGGFQAITNVAPGEVFDAETMAELSRVLIEEAAAMGDCVIVGRGSQCVLRGRPDTLHVFIYAPLTERIRRVQERLSGQADYQVLVESNDHKRTAYVHQFYQEDRLNPYLYHLMVNSSLGEDAVVSTILCAMKRA